MGGGHDPRRHHDASPDGQFLLRRQDGEYAFVWQVFHRYRHHLGAVALVARTRGPRKGPGPS